MSEPTIFEKILNGDISGDIRFQDELCFVLEDINPQAPTHLLIIPKKVIPHLDHAEPDDAHLLGHLLLVAKTQATELGLNNGFRVIINNGPNAGESVPHLHVHLLGGRTLTWPPG